MAPGDGRRRVEPQRGRLVPDRRSLGARDEGHALRDEASPRPSRVVGEERDSASPQIVRHGDGPGHGAGGGLFGQGRELVDDDVGACAASTACATSRVVEDVDGQRYAAEALEHPRAFGRPVDSEYPMSVAPQARRERTAEGAGCAHDEDSLARVVHGGHSETLGTTFTNGQRSNDGRGGSSPRRLFGSFGHLGRYTRPRGPATLPLAALAGVVRNARKSRTAHTRREGAVASAADGSSPSRIRLARRGRGVASKVNGPVDF